MKDADSDYSGGIVHICFSCSNRYAEQVNPLLVQAQRKLVTRVSQYSGPAVPQPHFQLAEQEIGGPITSEKYARLQLKVQIKDDDQRSEINPGAHIDPEGHDVYSGMYVILGQRCLQTEKNNETISKKTNKKQTKHSQVRCLDVHVYVGGKYTTLLIIGNIASRISWNFA